MPFADKRAGDALTAKLQAHAKYHATTTLLNSFLFFFQI